MTLDKQLYIVSIGPGGSAEFMTLKAAKVIKMADVAIYAGEMIGSEIRAMIGGKSYISKQFTTQDIQAIILSAIKDEKRVALLEPGDVSLYSGEPGAFFSLSENIRWLLEQAITFEVVPGVSSWSVLCAKLGVENVFHDTNQTVIVHSTRYKPLNHPLNRLDLLAKHNASLVFFISIHSLKEIVQTCLLHYPPDTPLIIGHKVSWGDESIIKTTLAAAVPMMDELMLPRHTLVLVGECYQTMELK